MKDGFGREVNYLRASVTDLCNLRCRYCMPAEGVVKKGHGDMMTEDEMIRAIEAASELGVRKVRITGGEPLVKRNILSICRRAAAVPGIEEVCLTTNGTLLSSFALPLKEAGVRRINVSLDTLDPERYAHMTRGGRLEDALKGIDAALAAGFEGVKLNAVLIRGFNDDELGDLAGLTQDYPLDLRFIELMPMSEAAGFDGDAYMTSEEALTLLPGLMPLAEEGVARMYRFPGARGRVGFISPMSCAFCARCSRIRLTADGHIKPCLHFGAEFPIRGMSRDEMRQAIARAIRTKPMGHDLAASRHSSAGRSMNRIGG